MTADNTSSPVSPAPAVTGQTDERTSECIVTREDANNYCAILSALGMEEEGDPVAAVKRLIAFEDDANEAAALASAPAGAGEGASRTIEDCPELNLSNYDAVDVERLNDWAIRADAEIDRLASLAGEPAVAAQTPMLYGMVVRGEAMREEIVNPDDPRAASGTAVYTLTPAVAADEGRTQAARDVLAERERQVTVEGWTPEHDDQHNDGAMARAAAAYCLCGEGPPPAGVPSEFHSSRPWDFNILRAIWPSSWNWPTPKDRRRNLIRAGALILAEIERLDRRAASQDEQQEKQ